LLFFHKSNKITMKTTKWLQLSREEVFHSPFLNVYHDQVRVPNGTTRDYFLTEKSDIVIVVATTSDGQVMLIDEYKYAANSHMLVLPAGHVETDEDPIETAKRELLEETGYTGEEYTYIGRLYESPVQDLHKVFVVKVNNVVKKINPQYEPTEDITTHPISLETLKDHIISGKIVSCSTLGALAVTGLI